MKRPLRRGDVYLVQLKGSGSNNKRTSVQKGLRPVVVVQNNTGNKFSTTTIVCPITSKQKSKNFPTHVAISPEGKTPLFDQPSIILAEQITTLENSDLFTYLGTLPSNCIDQLNKALKVSMGL